jgi:phage shock protein E
MTSKTIIDVRTPEEFRGGHVAGSLNIPLQEVERRLEEIKVLNQPIILCCQSGARSGSATAFLKKMGIDCENGGGWMEVNYRMQLENAVTP